VVIGQLMSAIVVIGHRDAGCASCPDKVCRGVESRDLMGTRFWDLATHRRESVALSLNASAKLASAKMASAKSSIYGERHPLTLHIHAAVG